MVYDISYIFNKLPFNFFLNLFGIYIYISHSHESMCSSPFELTM